MLSVVSAPERSIIDPIRIETLINRFISDQDVKENSRNQYRRTLNQYFIWTHKEGYKLSDIERSHILNYKDSLSETKSNLTVGSYITSVRRFYEWTEANKFYPNIAKGVRTPKRKHQFSKAPLLPEQAKELLSLPGTLRDKAIINLLLRTGLRTIEVIRANVGDIIMKGAQRVLLVHGKGRDAKDNFVLLTDKTYTPIAEYLATRPNNSALEPLFISDSNNSKGGRLSTRTISFIAKEGLKTIGLDNKQFTAHSLRHTAGTSILRAGGSIETAQHMLRHSNPATTQIYIATLEEERRLKNSGEALIDGIY